MGNRANRMGVIIDAFGWLAHGWLAWMVNVGIDRIVTQRSYETDESRNLGMIPAHRATMLGPPQGSMYGHRPTAFVGRALVTADGPSVLGLRCSELRWQFLEHKTLFFSKIEEIIAIE